MSKNKDEIKKLKRKLVVYRVLMGSLTIAGGIAAYLAYDKIRELNNENNILAEWNADLLEDCLSMTNQLETLGW